MPNVTESLLKDIPVAADLLEENGFSEVAEFLCKTVLLPRTPSGRIKPPPCVFYNEWKPQASGKEPTQ